MHKTYERPMAVNGGRHFADDVLGAVLTTA